MKQFILLVILVLAAVRMAAGQGLTLHGLISEAEQSNPALKASLARYEALKARAAQRGYLEDPKLGAGYFLQSVETRVGPQRATVSISQTFPWFGTLDARKQSAALMAEAAYQQYLDERNHVAFEVTSVYNTMYVVTRSDDAVQEHLMWLGTLKDILTSRYENGRSGLSDVLRLEMELRTLENRREEFVDKLATLRVRLSELTGGEAIGTVQFPDTLATPAIHPDREEIIAALRQQNPSLQRFNRLSESWEQSGRAARNMGMPSFTIGAAYTVIDRREDIVLADNGKDAIIAPQIGISLPIFRGKYAAMEEEALREQDAVHAAREAAERKLESQASEALESVRNARRNLALYRGLSRLSKQARDIVIEEYTTAGSTIDDVIQVERQYIDYQLKLEHARAEFSAGAARIEYITGSREE